MTLTAYSPFPTIPELVYIVDPALPKDVCVIAKANTKHGELWRTKHGGPNRPMKELRAALAEATA